MITIITGTPGSGKTLYTVSKLLRKLLGEYIDVKGPDGELTKQPRRIFSNIKGLLLDHELIGPGGAWRQVDKGKGLPPEWVFEGEGQGLRDWHLWAKPGDVIVYDEVQEVWKPRANGSPVPPDIGALETHRHMGVDFILITQGISLTERNLSMLCGRHLHVRRVANMPFAVVYEWDGASRTLLFSKSIAREKWWYDRSAYKLYKSAEVHTKSKRRLPGVLMTLIVAVVALGTLGPTIYSRYGERFGWTKPVTLPGQQKAPTGSQPVPAPPAGAPASTVATTAGEKAQPVFWGCASNGKRCTCYDSAGVSTPKEVGFCEVKTRGVDDRPPISLAWLHVPEQDLHERELSALSRPDTELIASARVARERSERVKATMALPSNSRNSLPDTQQAKR
jgi:zona occludens toxin